MSPYFAVALIFETCVFTLALLVSRYLGKQADAFLRKHKFNKDTGDFWEFTISYVFPAFCFAYGMLHYATS